jgi:hypothetical protein
MLRPFCSLLRVNLSLGKPFYPRQRTQDKSPRESPSEELMVLLCIILGMLDVDDICNRTQTADEKIIYSISAITANRINHETIHQTHLVKNPQALLIIHNLLSPRTLPHPPILWQLRFRDQTFSPSLRCRRTSLSEEICRFGIAAELVLVFA